MNKLNRLLAGLAVMVGTVGFAQQLPDFLQAGGTDTNQFRTEAVSKLDMSFKQNKGQWSSDLMFQFTKKGFVYWATNKGFVIDTYQVVGTGKDGYRKGHVLRFELDGAKGTSAVGEGIGDRGVHIDYINQLGLNQVSGVKNVRAYDEAVVRGVLPGVDVRHYADQGNARYDFIVKPGVSVNQLQFNVRGTTNVEITPDGRLSAKTSVGPVSLDGLFAYQMVNGVKTQVAAKFTKVGPTKVGFSVGNYDRSKPLVIDPLVYGTYFGGSSDDITSAIASDSSGRVYFSGSTLSDDLPITDGPYQVNLLTSQDAFVGGLSEDAYNVNYVAYIHGLGVDSGDFLEVDQYGDLWMCGATTSFNFPGSAEIDIKKITPDNGPNAEVITGGTWDITFGTPSQNTDPLNWNATAQEVQDALNALQNAPTGGFICTGGPLPDTPIHVKWNLKANGGPLVVNGDIRPYEVRATDPAELPGPLQASADLFQTIDITQGVGLDPNDGTFTLSVTENATTYTTDPIPWDADAQAVVDALTALQPFTDGTPVPAALGGPLWGAPVHVVFLDSNSQPTTPLAITIDPSGLKGGDYGAENDVQQAYVMRFKQSQSDFLDPLSLPTVTYLRNIDFPTGFAVRPQPLSTGNIEFAVVGNANAAGDAVPGIPGNTPASGVFGWLAVGRSSHTVANAQFLSSRSTYIGGQLESDVQDVAFDPDGNVYVVGSIASLFNSVLGPNSPNFATTTGVFPGGSLQRKGDGFVRKYSAAGALAYSAIFGSSGDDTASTIAVDNFGNAYIGGVTGGTNFPRTVGVFDDIFLGGEPFLMKVNANATSIVYSTTFKLVRLPLTPLPVITDIEVDARGNAYLALDVLFGGVLAVTPNAPNIPGQEAALDNAPVGDQDGGLIVMNSTATGMLYAGYEGGDPIGPFASSEGTLDVTIDRSGGVWTTGYTTLRMPNSLLSPNAFQPFALPLDGWIVKQKIGLPVLQRITVTPNTIAASLGASADVNVVLRNAATDPGVDVTLRVVDPNVARFNSESGPGTIVVTIPTGATTLPTPVKVFSKRVNAATSTVIEARLDGDLVQTSLGVVPWLESFTISQTDVRGGNQLTGTVRLYQDAPAGGITVNMTTDSPQFVSFPNSGAVTVPAGQRVVTFLINTEGVDADRIASVTANLAGASISRSLRLLPAIIKGLLIDPNRVTGGEPSAGLVQLDGKAASNTRVILTQSGAVVGFDQVIKFPQGSTELVFNIGTDFTPVDTTCTITGTVNGTSDSDTLFILNNQVNSITLSPTSVEGGTSAVGTVRIAKPAGPTGMNIPILNTKPAYCSISPATVNIPAGQTTGTFNIQTFNVTEQQVVRFRASKSGYNRPFADLTIRPITVNLTLQIAPTSVSGGASSTGTVTIDRPAPSGGLAVQLTSNNAAVTVPATIVIPAGATTRNFVVSTSAVTASTTATVTARIGSKTATAQLTVLPAAIISFSFSPNSVRGGQSSTGTIIIDTPAPSGGLPIALTADKPTFVTFPATVTIPAGQTSVTFNVNSGTVTRTTAVVFTATISGRSPMNATLTLTGTP